MKIGFDKLYSFATENVQEYFNNLEIENKSLLTVGSSSDQVINGIILDAKKITLLDINPNTKHYFELKKAAILSLNRKEFIRFLYDDKLNLEDYKKIKKELENNSKEDAIFWNELFKKYNYRQISKDLFSTDLLSKDTIIKENNYLTTRNSFNEIKEKIRYADVDFKNANIFDLKNSLNNEMYDRIVLSNILQYIEYFAKNNEYKTIKKCFDNLCNHLENELNTDGLDMLFIKSLINNHGTDGVLTYTKKR